MWTSKMVDMHLSNMTSKMVDIYLSNMRIFLCCVCAAVVLLWDNYHHIEGWSVGLRITADLNTYLLTDSSAYIFV